MPDKIKPSDCKLITQIAKEEILLDAIHKTVGMVAKEYDLTIGQVCGCLEIIKSEYKQNYFDQKYPKNG